MSKLLALGELTSILEGIPLHILNPLSFSFVFADRYFLFSILEADLVPSDDGGNLYIRPNLVETSESYGIKEDAYAAEALLYVVTTLNLGKGLYPSAEGKGIRLDACKEYIRAWPGGTGSYKLGANYGEFLL